MKSGETDSTDQGAELQPRISETFDGDQQAERDRSGLARLTLFALGVVFGDIGTSPLYAFRESFKEHLALNPDSVMGVLSLITWSLLIVICFKYLLIVLRASQEGEGGILVLTALVSRRRAARGLLLCGLFGTALLYGDGILTPAISVLSAVEGLKVATDSLSPYIIHLTVGILGALFLFQRHGTGTVGKVFGPIVALWFLVLGALGVVNIMDDPKILLAANPVHAVNFFAANGLSGLWVLGSVFLVVTGGEALYADLGHFGRKPIQYAWFGMVLPGLLLNYYGQGALLLKEPGALENPFYEMAPDWGLYPLVVLATMATVIASQALISGAFSLTAQAVQMGYLPLIEVVHTSSEEEGQVYVPIINWMLAVGCIGVVVGFRSSSALAAAYGVAVTVTMVITTILLFYLARTSWDWPTWKAVLICGPFLFVDLSFFIGNVRKIPQGGWFPLLVASVVFVVMTTWRTGTSKMRKAVDKMHRDWDEFADECSFEERPRTPGVAVYLTKEPQKVPISLLSSWRHFNTLHEKILIAKVITTELPFLRGQKRVEVEDAPMGFHQVRIYFGFRETHDVPRYLEQFAEERLGFDLGSCLYFISSTEMSWGEQCDWAGWRASLFQLLSNNAAPIRDVFRLPPDRMVELGLAVKID